MFLVSLVLPSNTTVLPSTIFSFSQPGVFDEAVKGVDAVLHTASPFHFNTEDDPQGKLIRPAVRGTLNILNSIKNHGNKVKVREQDRSSCLS